MNYYLGFCMDCWWLLTGVAILLIPFAIGAARGLVKRTPGSRAVRGAVVTVELATALSACIGLHILFAQAQAVAQDSQCTTNLKDLQLALAMYTQDSDETFPPASRWTDAALPYLKGNAEDKEQRLHCPATTSAFSYAWNSQLGDRSLETMANLSQTVSLFESDAKGRNASGGIDVLTREHRHYAGINLGFCDGHTRFYRRDAASDPKLWVP
jgi:prepilin-type processing-associated H-X9-DG protein